MTKKKETLLFMATEDAAGRVHLKGDSLGYLMKVLVNESMKSLQPDFQNPNEMNVIDFMYSYMINFLHAAGPNVAKGMLDDIRKELSKLRVADSIVEEKSMIGVKDKHKS